MGQSPVSIEPHAKGPLKAEDSGRKAAIGPRLKTWVGVRSVNVGIKGRSVWEENQKAIRLVCGRRLCCLTGWAVFRKKPRIITLI